METLRFARAFLFMLSGLFAWAAHFAVIYAFNALACARDFASGLVVPLGVSAATVLALAAVGAIMIMASRRTGPARSFQKGDSTDDFLRFMTIAVAALSALAIIWDGAPALVVSPCG